MSAQEFEIFTLFPAAIEAFATAGLMGKAGERGLVRVHCTDPRTFTDDRHRTVDDAPFGGGAGMVLKPGPVVAAIESVVAARGPMHTILLTPSGARFDQRAAERLSRLDRIGLLCGRYEGIDDRVREHWVDECLSIGDFVLNGGEAAAVVVLEAVARLRAGVLGNPESVATESFAATDTSGDPDAREAESWRPGVVLEHPHYTRPAEFRGHRVPEILLAGDHGRVEAWRRRTACLRTWSLRPDLRPAWSLAPDHPIVFAGSGEATDALAALGREFLPVGGPGSRMRDLKHLRRTLRRRYGAEPWVIGVGASEGPELGPRVVLDVLAFERQRPPGPLVLWIGDPADPRSTGPKGPEAWMALSERERGGSSGEGVRDNRGRRLAIPPGLIDISQPPAAPVDPVTLARRALAALRQEGLLRHPGPAG